MIKKSFPIIMMVLLVVTWVNVIYEGYSGPKQYNTYIEEGDLLSEEGLYVKAVSKYESAYSLKPSVELFDKVLDSYKLMGNKSTYIDMCMKGINTYPEYEKFYERVLDYYSVENKGEFFRYVVEYKKLFEENKVINEHYIQAAKTTYLTDMLHAEPIVLSENEYLIFEEKYDHDKDETKVYAILKKFDGTKPFSGEYKNIRLADEGYFVQNNEGVWTMVNHSGYTLSKSTRNTVTDIVGKAAGCYIAIDNGKYVLMNSEMKFADLIYDYISSSSDGVYAVCKDGKWAIVPDDVIGYDGDYPYDEVMINAQGVCSVNGKIVVKKQGKYCIINPEEKILHESSYNMIKAYESEQKTVFSDGKKYGFMNDDGSVFVKAMFEDAKPFKSNVAAVKKGGKWGFIDIYGNTVIEPVYSEVTNVMSNGMILVLDEDGYWKLINIPLVSGKK